MSEIAGQTGLSGTATAVVHESYSFACMRCGHGWEQSYAIEHHTDVDGHQYVTYVADGRVVPSPLTRPTCQNCDGHEVRIMRPGRVSSVRSAEEQYQHHVPEPVLPEKPEGTRLREAPESRRARDGEQHHWHLSDLLHLFHHRKAG
ncbi:hypothetical protein [Streptomyces sp. L2]|uniref:hypothetical protein n=1 Tax=Streptomyces sp. L2 TaxID=2162665 RepID=UPI001013B45C|nr:hypothetical protein [Streptomyces sp. L2]